MIEVLRDTLDAIRLCLDSIRLCFAAVVVGDVLLFGVLIALLAASRGRVAGCPQSAQPKSQNPTIPRRIPAPPKPVTPQQSPKPTRAELRRRNARPRRKRRKRKRRKCFGAREEF